MSDITTTLQDAYREFCIQAHGAGLGLREAQRRREGEWAAVLMRRSM